ncbi:nucleotidyltransferase family protein [Clostridium formicaceticum]|uniref:Alcohol dehydrogenase n=2 Tax=Clostridium formicaceticum TaxID=1497 RepID=A0AAC9WHI2_9CLOT|nr:nucleotidyltransferase family protein [Clostridium formicaceticum]AOY78500.1 alcohol dehydrogenase [Clostridium formicaceticum]ARE88814.1 D-glycero-alpha-D-manno-heptose 1-phosphate guanylyltransferase [Clostridium formicaceticum]
MKKWEKALISPNTKIQEAIRMIDLSSLQIAMVISQNNKLLGTVTDGDIRRGLLNGLSLDDPVERIMNKHPITITEMKDKKSTLKILKDNKIRHLPVVDNEGCVIGIERLEDLLDSAKNENWVILMAGGLGIRLKPLTDDCPKPMLSIGGKPLLEIILNHFIEQGFYQFCFSINYRGEQIKSYFGDGSKWGVEIHYLHEEKKMGTAGSLSLFSMKTEKPIIVMNGDILTKVNFKQLIDFHLEHWCEATVAVRNYDFQIPYGVVKVNKDRLIGFEEKPIYSSFINAGIYVLNPRVLDEIPKNAYFDMNQLLERMLKNGKQIVVFPIREYWMDIGAMEDFHRAKLDFYEVFQ